jgi:hypothetical protein
MLFASEDMQLFRGEEPQKEASFATTFGLLEMKGSLSVGLKLDDSTP